MSHLNVKKKKILKKVVFEKMPKDISRPIKTKRKNAPRTFKATVKR